MTTITATVIEDTDWAGARITTLELYYPRIIHSEFMTHRVFSRNAGSSRAIPVSRLISAVVDDPFVPEEWGLNQKGMQAQAAQANADVCRSIWLDARDNAVASAKLLADLNVHKQLVNRLLEPFSHIRVVATATGDVWDHFFHLRDHPDAQPQFMVLAQRIRDALSNSGPRRDAFHLPYVTQEERQRTDLAVGELMMLSAARCARVSYRTHEGIVPRYEEDMGLAERLWSDPPHLSPFEHQAIPAETPTTRHANFVGWQSYRNQKGF